MKNVTEQARSWILAIRFGNGVAALALIWNYCLTVEYSVTYNTVPALIDCV